MLQHIQLEKVLRAVSLDKDVDGLHPINVGRLVLRGLHPTFIPCTPLGCLEILRRSGVQIENKHAVVIGCSNVVGLPTALLLQVQLVKITHSFYFAYCKIGKSLWLYV
jgi:5,10-methylene-tetrahydrofolate dehydrogenase/methenyl tetrahydrofolate cyclohydrolase